MAAVLVGADWANAGLDVRRESYRPPFSLVTATASSLCFRRCYMAHFGLSELRLVAGTLEMMRCRLLQNVARRRRRRRQGSWVVTQVYLLLGSTRSGARIRSILWEILASAAALSVVAMVEDLAGWWT